MGSSRIAESSGGEKERSDTNRCVAREVPESALVSDRFVLSGSTGEDYDARRAAVFVPVVLL